MTSVDQAVCSLFDQDLKVDEVVWLLMIDSARDHYTLTCFIKEACLKDWPCEHWQCFHRHFERIVAHVEALVQGVCAKLANYFFVARSRDFGKDVVFIVVHFFNCLVLEPVFLLFSATCAFDVCLDLLAITKMRSTTLFCIFFAQSIRTVDKRWSLLNQTNFANKEEIGQGLLPQLHPIDFSVYSAFIGNVCAQFWVCVEQVYVKPC